MYQEFWQKSIRTESQLRLTGTGFQGYMGNENQRISHAGTLYGRLNTLYHRMREYEIPNDIIEKATQTRLSPRSGKLNR